MAALPHDLAERLLDGSPDAILICAPAGTVQPGRDHWPRAFSNIWAGGGIQTGGVIGATDKRGEEVTESACDPGASHPPC